MAEPNDTPTPENAPTPAAAPAPVESAPVPAAVPAVAEKPASPPPSNKPDEDEPESDLKMAFKHNTRWLGMIKEGVESFFHYFFVGCISLLGFAITFSLPLLIMGFLLCVLLLPAYIWWYLFIKPEAPVTVMTVIVTIFWSGYFFTHGWPRLRASLMATYERLQPMLKWLRQTIAQFGDDE